jgi:superfamily II DNA or RNA helicase
MDYFNNQVNLLNLNILGGGRNFPSIDDPDFQKKIGKIFERFSIKKKLSFKDICFPEKFTYQLPQLFVSEFINPNTPYKGILLYHKIGAGKTCAAVNIAEKWKDKKKIMFVCPASLVGNMYKELRSLCAGNEYISEKEKKELNNHEPGSTVYDTIIEKVNKRIDKNYTILSYNKFVDLSNRGKLSLIDHLLIIDEVQNIVSEHGSYYQAFLNEIKNGPKSLRIVIMSATPIFDKPIELALTMNLLKPEETFPINPSFNNMFLRQISEDGFISYDIKNANKLKKLLTGYVSYYKGAPDYVFPKKIIRIVRCRMSSYQYSCYKTVEGEEGGLKMGDILKLPNNFFIGSRMISNIAFPDRLIKEEGYNALKGKDLKENLEKYSIKFTKILKNIKKCKGTCFVYSNFREYGGIQSFIKVLAYNGYKDFNKEGPGKHRYAIWSGDEDIYTKEYTRDYFNKKENEDGSLIKVILGSPAIKEGVSLLRVRQVHIMEPYWNMSRLEQVMGRAVRFCSHKDMNKEDRDVTIYIYIAVDPQNKKLTVDRHILNMAFSKDKLTKQFENVIKDSAIDSYLFQN